MKLLQTTVNPKEINSLALAYMGDAVFEIYVRRHLLEKGIIKPHLLQKESIKYVSAKSQSYAIHSLIDTGKLLEEEIAIVKRGRNAKSHSVPKNTDVQTYRYSTAFEALMGYHYLAGNFERMEELIHHVITTLDHRKEDMHNGR